MGGRVQRIAMIAMHSSPADAPGRGDSGGMNVAIRSVATQLASRGIEVDLITRADRAPYELVIADGVTVRALAAGHPEPLAKSDLARVADEFGEAVARLAGRDAPRYQVLHAHYWLSGLATLPVALELKLPLVQSFHTIGAMKNRTLAPGDEPEPQTRLRSEAYLAMQADALVAGSSAEVSSIIDDLRAPPERLWVIPPGVDTTLFSPARRANEASLRARLGLEEGRPLLVVAGRIQPLKDPELAIEVLAGVRRMRGGPAERTPLLVIAGEIADPDYRVRLETVAQDLGIAAEVRLVGPLPRELMADLFAAAALTLVPSHSETFGLVALESAASGTPVIAYRGSGLVDSVANGRSGVLVASRDPGEWVSIVSGLLENPTQRDALAASARLFAEGFTWATSATSLLGVYESLAGRG